jgi:hypothetical protein
MDREILEKLAQRSQIRNLGHQMKRVPKKADPSDTTVTVGRGSTLPVYLACAETMPSFSARLRFASARAPLRKIVVLSCLLSKF